MQLCSWWRVQIDVEEEVVEVVTVSTTSSATNTSSLLSITTSKEGIRPTTIPTCLTINHQQVTDSSLLRANGLQLGSSNRADFNSRLRSRTRQERTTPSDHWIQSSPTRLRNRTEVDLDRINSAHLLLNRTTAQATSLQINKLRVLDTNLHTTKVGLGLRGKLKDQLSNESKEVGMHPTLSSPKSSIDAKTGQHLVNQRRSIRDALMAPTTPRTPHSTRSRNIEMIDALAPVVKIRDHNT